MMKITVERHPLLHAASFVTTLPRVLSECSSPSWMVDLLRTAAPAPVARDESVRSAVRDLLRQGGYKPTGRGKPASEYLVRAAEEGGLRSINLHVDACNVVSLHSGFPISVIDLDLAAPPLRIGIAAGGTSYVFNAGGQEIDVAGLLCLHDAAGACANAVKDSQRTKTRPETMHTLSVIWGVRGFEERVTAAESWYRELLARCDLTIGDVQLEAPIDL